MRYKPNFAFIARFITAGITITAKGQLLQLGISYYSYYISYYRRNSCRKSSASALRERIEGNVIKY